MATLTALQTQIDALKADMLTKQAASQLFYLKTNEKEKKEEMNHVDDDK